MVRLELWPGTDRRRSFPGGSVRGGGMCEILKQRSATTVGLGDDGRIGCVC